MQHTIQIDIKQLHPAQDRVVGRIYLTGGASFPFEMTYAHYEALMNSGVNPFLRDGKTADTAGVLNTTRIYTADSQ